jgi:hypothetical protein
MHHPKIPRSSALCGRRWNATFNPHLEPKEIAMTTINPNSGNAPGLREAVSKLQVESVFLHAMAQGIDALHDTLVVECSPASNAMPALFKSLIEWADKLSIGIEELENAIRKAGDLERAGRGLD